MDSMKLKRCLKNNKLAVKLYNKLRQSVTATGISTDIPEVQKIGARPVEEEYEKIRLNILVPSVDKKHVFGGIATALQFFEQLGKETNCDMRIILTDALLDQNNMVTLDGYTVVECEDTSFEKKQIVPFANRYEKTIPVAKNDIFLATGWWTAYTIAPVIRWQREHYKIEGHKLLYFIQDFEPGFYPWSSRYLMADSTYRLDIKTVAIFNSNLLREYFETNGYSFDQQFSFDPILNKDLKQYLIQNKDGVARKKQIIFYGRPSVQRNAFELIITSLKEWVKIQSDVSEWNIYALGETFENIPLGNGKEVVALGKLSLEGYGKVMLESKIGISLMVSPHPSYPPLEMSTFGIKTITNTYGNKDLTHFNDNIISLQSCSDTAIAKELVRLCEDTEESQIKLDAPYIKNEEVFQQIIHQIKEEIKLL